MDQFVSLVGSSAAYCLGLSYCYIGTVANHPDCDMEPPVLERDYEDIFVIYLGP